MFALVVGNMFALDTRLLHIVVEAKKIALNQQCHLYNITSEIFVFLAKKSSTQSH
jgi:hypothetical protein